VLPLDYVYISSHETPAAATTSIITPEDSDAKEGEEKEVGTMARNIHQNHSENRDNIDNVGTVRHIEMGQLDGCVNLFVLVELGEANAVRLAEDFRQIFTQAWFPIDLLTVVDVDNNGSTTVCNDQKFFQANQVIQQQHRYQHHYYHHHCHARGDHHVSHPLQQARCPAAANHNTSVFQFSQPDAHLRPLLVRGTSFYAMLGFSGALFSIEKHKRDDFLTQDEFAAKWNRNFKEMSQPILDGEEYSHFISYRWRMGRFMLFSTMVVHFNHRPAVVISLAVTVLIMFVAGIVNYYNNVVILPSSDHVWLGPGFLFSVPCRAVLMFILLPIFSQAFVFKRNIFVDKLCIHQVDRELSRAALLSLPYILSRCKRLTCIVDAEYFKRLWCMYEIAMYKATRTKTKPKVVFVYSQQCWLFLVVFSLTSIIQMACFVVGAKDHGEPRKKKIFTHLYVDDVFLNIGFWVMWLSQYYVGRLYYQTVDCIRRQSESFDVRYAVCAVETDKDVLLASIQQQFHSSRICRLSRSSSCSQARRTSKDSERMASNSNSPAIAANPTPPDCYSKSRSIIHDGSVANCDDDDDDDLEGAQNMMDECCDDNPLDRFNESVRGLLREQVLSSTGRILPYTLVVTAFCLRWFRVDEVGTMFNIHDWLDWFFYETPWGQNTWFQGSTWTNTWFTILFKSSFFIFIQMPLLFYGQTSIIRFFCFLERRFSKSVFFFKWWFFWVPLLFLYSIWEQIFNIVWGAIAPMGVIELFGVHQWKEFRGKKTFPFPFNLGITNYFI